MRRFVVVPVLLLCLVSFVLPPAGAAEKDVAGGEDLFKKHCAMCHPDGGNIINPKKTLGSKALAEANIKSAKDVVGKMRNPGPGMPRFDEKSLPDEQAKAIAEYVLTTFR